MSLSNSHSIPRRHDLDALRAIAMLAGIGLHAALSFAPIPWIVQDTRQSDGFYLFFSAIHGFRMPLFFLISGFFTAMLWRKRGLTELMKHRFKRVFIPCMLGLVTVIPLLNFVSQRAASQQAKPPIYSNGTAENLWEAARIGDLATLELQIELGVELNARQPSSGQTALSLAIIGNHPKVVAQLLDAGANPNEPVADGTPPLHFAAILGRAKIAEQLIASGANVDGANGKGQRINTMLELDWATTRFIAGLMGVAIDETELNEGRAAIIESLGDSVQVRQKPPGEQAIGTVIFLLFLMPVFHHLWFLWFLCWLVCMFAVYAALIDAIGIQKIPSWFTASPLRYCWLVPITLLPQAVMGLQFPTFGPDTSAGILPLPHVLFYYSIFFGFGALYYDCQDDQARLGRWWRFTLPVSLLVLFPIGFELTTGKFGFAELIAPESLHRMLAVVIQATFAWTMTFGCMGMFRGLLHRESKAMRYISDSSYWLYVAHLPLVVALQLLVRDWPLPGLVKFLLICVVTSGLLLMSYQTMVRYTWIGRLLNGPRKRPEPVIEAELVETPQVQS